MMFILAATDITTDSFHDQSSSANHATIELDEWDRIYIILGTATFLLVVLILLICVLHPMCFLHQFCPFQYEPLNDGHRSPPPAYGSLYDCTLTPIGKTHPMLKGSTHGHTWYPLAPLRESEASDWSDISLPEMIEMKKDTTSANKRKASRTSDYSSSSSTTAGYCSESRLAYGVMFDRMAGRLDVRVIQLGNFRVTEPDGAMAPYVKVRLYRAPKHFFTFKLKAGKEMLTNNMDMELQTKIQRRTDNPVFNETFTVVIEDPDPSAYTIRFLVCDFDKFSRHVVVGEVTCDLSKLDLLSGNELLFNDALEEPTEDNLGEIHVALMYLPTAEKLSLLLLNCRQLKPFDNLKKNNMEVYVKITMMHDGRPVKKHKSSSKTNDLNPVFNETFVFDIPAYQLDKVYFGINVIEVDQDKEDSRHLIGRLYLGVNFDPDSRAQWMEMIQNARKQVACWHKLQS